jgi:squalene-hopene/tetraprenyl-beta-curcumene cyclase
MRGIIVGAVIAAFALHPLETSCAQNPAADAAKLAKRGLNYFEAAQAEDGSFSAPSGPAVTAIVAAAMLAHGAAPSDPTVAKALDYVLKHVHPDGGIYAEGSRYKNYETCIAIMSLARANEDGKYDALLDKAAAFVKQEQWDDGEGHDSSSPYFGGAGYGGHSRPDLSNTSFLIDALQALETPPDDPAIQRALVFVSRCQNLETEHNQTEFAAKNPDGGFYYTIAAGGSSQAGPTETGGLRSYGSMTYAGLRSMIYAGVDAEDERVKAAREWIAKHYTLDENPGMGDAGLYYYYHTFAKTLSAVGDEQLADGAGAAHDWRQDLVATLAAAQRADGSWANANERWLEGDPNLVTAYALLALSYLR